MLKAAEFSFNENITVVNDAQFQAHYTLYEGYIKSYNEIDGIFKAGNDEPDAANSTYSKFRSLKRGESYALNAIILHELYFSNIGGIANEIPACVLKLIDRDFGTFENWKLDFIATAKASRGWTILAFEQKTQRFVNMSLDTHDMGGIVYSFPLIVLDVYEHAYFMQYGPDKVSYINNFLYNVNWATIKVRAEVFNRLL